MGKFSIAMLKNQVYIYIAESTKLLRLCESFFYGPKPVVTGTFCAANLSFGPTAQERASL